jgi:hypothetical protein
MGSHSIIVFSAGSIIRVMPGLPGGKLFIFSCKESTLQPVAVGVIIVVTVGSLTLLFAVGAFLSQ